MKKSEIILTAILVGLLLMCNPTYGQKKKGADKKQEVQPTEVVEEPSAEPQLLERNALRNPTKALSADEQAHVWEKQGWKVENYDLTSQINYSWQIASLVHQVTFTPIYWWAENVTMASTIDDAKNRNVRFCCKNIIQQASAVIVLTSQEVLANHKISQEQKDKLMNCLANSTEGAVVNMAQKSLEMYMETDGQVRVRTIMIVDRDELYDFVRKDCKRRLGTGDNPDFFPPIVDDIFRHITGR